MIILDALKEYVKKHGDGNPVFTLDHYQDADFQVCPAVFREASIWRKYYTDMTKKTYEEIDFQLGMILGIHNKKLQELS